ncbi:hypothetical protein [Acidicapsa ligni]|uniref:hypothetical protein n=1 Tax=Acidicapsa ligni TaxID=542300 RepID=UPI0021E0E51D|nr:hypothetical protein [Acidicapsa ligni]
MKLARSQKSHTPKPNDSRNGASSDSRRIVRVVTTLFVAFHLVAILAFALPLGVVPAYLLAFLSPYTRCVGLNEMYDTFAPNPKSEEEFLKAIVFARSGNMEVYSFPRMEDLSLWQRYSQERYRKFVESVLCKDCSGLWPDIEKEAARRVSMSPSDPPDRVILVRFDSPIDPAKGLVGNEAGAKPTIVSQQSLEPEDQR